jgi:hypothetical protein
MTITHVFVDQLTQITACGWRITTEHALKTEIVDGSDRAAISCLACRDFVDARNHNVVAFSREEIWRLIERVSAMAQSVANPHWKRTYFDLLHALNVVDAHMARSIAYSCAACSNDLLRSAGVRTLDDER